jgi:hypothetical protein
MDEALDRVLKLVSEGRLTAAEAAPILDALAQRDKLFEKGSSKASAGQTMGGEPAESIEDKPARFARIQVIEGGRRAVDLRVPIGLGKFALSRVPGLSGEQISEVQDAMASGSRGPILDIEDADGDGVRIVLE